MGPTEGESGKHSARLGLGMLLYVSAVIALITLAPFHFVARPDHGLTLEWTGFDLVMNVAMFAPLGFLWRVARPGVSQPVERAFLFGALGSAAIETAQLFAPARFTSGLDVLTNAMGMAIGARCFDFIAGRVDPSRAVRWLALELPLMGLVYLLLPLAWLVGLASEADAWRAWLLVPLAAIVGVIVGSVRAGYRVTSIAENRLTVRLALPAWIGATAWSAFAWLPTGAHDTRLLLAVVVAGAGAATLGIVATLRRTVGEPNRRFELPTLRLVLPLFALTLAISSLWPLDEIATSWRGAFALAPSGVSIGTRDVYRALQHVASFTVLGYIVAEFHGRSRAHFRDVAPRVFAWSLAIGALLEGVRGWHPAHSASGLLLVLVVAAALFGARLYGLQRDFVRASLEAASLDSGGPH